MQANEAIKMILEDKRFNRQVRKLDNETLRIVAKDYSKARDYAQKAIKKLEPSKLNKEYIITVTGGMQKLAQIILQERTT